MPLVSARTLLAQAQTAHYGIALFDIFEMTGCEDAVAAAEERRAPLIVGMYQSTFEKRSAHAFIAALRWLAGQCTTPVALMLDHGISVEQCLRAAEAGFTDVMYDGSKLPIEENIANTARVVEAAHAADVGVEAELGHVGSGRDYESFGAKRMGFTDPADVERFTRESSVDMLAVAIGTAHGVYQGEPRLDLDLLTRIRARTRVPLVLHGGTGLSESQFRQAIAGGISKINVATDLVLAMAERMRKVAADPKAPFFKLTGAIHEAMAERCTYYFDLFGASGKAVTQTRE